LNAVEAKIDRLGELLDQQRLGQPRHAAQQAVAAGEERNQDLAHDALLSDDRLRQLALETAGDIGDALERDRGVGRGRQTEIAVSHSGVRKPFAGVYYDRCPEAASRRAGPPSSAAAPNATRLSAFDAQPTSLTSRHRLTPCALRS
jgi:hypothetical protein